MKKNDVIRAWRDEEYRSSLSEQELAALPEHPAGILAVDDEVLQNITGGCGFKTTFVMSCVPPGYSCP